jgi:prepilin-type N-terminal cleavage/methylation domain-containing protein
MRNKQAFTLIELLVVVAIIAILAAILFPVFAQAREKARQITCLSNQKQLGLAFAQYVQDYDEKMPCGMYQAAGTPGSDIGEGWAGQVFPYVKAKGVFACPDDPTVPPAANIVVSYAYNQLLDSTPFDNPGVVSIAQITAPSSVVCLFEVTNGTTWGSSNAPAANEDHSPVGWGWPYHPPYGATAYATGDLGAAFSPESSTIPPRHATGSNWLACDCHVKWLKGTAISNGLTASTPDAPGNSATGQAAGSTNLTDVSKPGVHYTLTFSII